jgi:hypothetical protein
MAHPQVADGRTASDMKDVEEIIWALEGRGNRGMEKIT